MARKINITVMIAAFLSIALCLPAAASYLPFNTNTKMNVGIGSANPGQSLDVQGTVRALYFSGNGSGLSNLPSSTLWTNTNTNDVYLPSNGNVGIGTTITSAGAALTVMNGNVGIGTWVPNDLLNIGGGTPTTAASGIQFGSDSTADLYRSAANSLRTDATFFYINGGGGNAIYMGNGAIYTQGYSWEVANAGEAPLYSYNIVMNPSMGLAWSNNSNVHSGSNDTAFYRLRPAVLALGNGTSTTDITGTLILGNIGIGTINPFSRLNVNGGVGIGTSLTNGAYLNGNSAPSGGLIVQGNVGIGTFNPALPLSVTGDTYHNGNVGIGTTITTAGAALTVMNGNVGIGTWVPGHLLQVGANSFMDSNSITTSTFGVNSGGNGIAFAGSTNFAQIAGGNSFLEFGTAGVFRMYISNAGNVGIGTNIPGAELDVEGTLYPTVFYARGTNQNVGIGSLTPGQALDVTGTVRATFFSGNGSQLTGITSSQWTTTNSNDVYLPSNGNVGLGTTITSAGAALTVMNGNVGIGTWVPNGSLIVQGGNVGIGTATANYTLQVSSTATDPFVVTNPSVTSPSTNNIFFVNSGGDIVAGQNAGGADTLLSLGVPGFQRFEVVSVSGAFANIIAPSGGVYGWTSADANSALDTGVSRGAANKVYIGNGSQGNASGTLVANNIGIGTNLTTTSALSVMSGNVGIGTWLPDAALTINGQINFATASSAGTSSYFGQGAGGSIGEYVNATQQITFGGGNVTVGLQNTGVLGWFPGGISGGGDTFLGRMAAGVVGVGTSTTTNMLGVLAASNIGIGTFVTTAALDIKGNIGIGTVANDNYLKTAPPLGGAIIYGNVGIGTYNPIQALEVNGYILADVQYNYPAGFGALADNGGNLHVPEALLDSGDSPGTSGECLTTTGTQVAWGSCSGNVGVGTGFPSSPLHSVQFNNNGNFGGSSNFVFNGTNVGIGTVLSQNTLDIGSNVSIGTAYAGYQAAPSNGLIVQGNVGVGTFAPVKPFSVVGDTYLNGNLGIGTSTTTQGAFVVTNGNVGIATWSPVDTLQVGKYVSSSTGFEVDSNGNVGIGTTKTFGAALSIMNGNIGIGTWAPSTSLSIPNGNIYALNGIYVGANNAGSAAPGQALFNTSGINFNAANEGVVPISIGVASDTSTSTPGNFTIYAQSAGNSPFVGGNLILQTGAGNGSTNGVMQFESGATEKARMDANGNIGIGTVTPMAALGIVGNVGIGTIKYSSFVTTTPPAGGMIIEGNVGIGTWLPAGTLQVASGQILAPNGTAAAPSYSFSANSGTGLVYGINADTSVGISTGGNNYFLFKSDPRLSIASNATISWLNGTIATGSKDVGISRFGVGVLAVGNGNQGDLTGAIIAGNVGIGTNLTTTSALTVMNGNVGIGTWVPAYNLDIVNGTARERNVRRVSTTVSSSSLTVNTDTADLYTITALAANITFNNPSGSPNNGDLFEIRILDNGTARTIAWGTSFGSTLTSLPATTVASTTIRVLLEYNSANSLWECIGVT